MIPLTEYNLSRKPDFFASAIVRVEGDHNTTPDKNFLATFSGYGAEIISKEFLFWLSQRRKEDCSGTLPDGRGWSWGEVDGNAGVWEQIVD